MFLIFCFIFAAIATAAENDCKKEYCSKSKGFAAVWNVLVSMAIAYFGTKVFRHGKTEQNVGLLIAVLFVMAYNLFAQFVMFVGLAKDARDTGHESAQADDAAAAFSFLLAMVYLVLTVLLVRNRDDIIEVPPQQDSSTVVQSAPGSSAGAAAGGEVALT